MPVEPAKCPFKILVDTAESQPFTFQGFRGDSDKDYRPLVVDWEYKNLGRYPHSKGDYSVAGFSDRVAIERKSLEDCWSTVMGWETSNDRERGNLGRRDRFKCELENLSKLECSAVIVEASFSDCVQLIPAWGERPAEFNKKIFHRSILGMMQDYRVPWIFCESRRFAEVTTLRFFGRFWKHHHQEANSDG